VLSVRIQEAVELVVVDDGSDDPATLETLDALRAEVLVIRQENRGLAAARMTGVHATSAPYVFALDADDRLLAGALTDLADALDRDPAAAAAWGDTRFFGDVNRVVGTARTIDPWRITFVNELPAAALFRRDVLNATGGWKLAEACEDWELWMDLAERNLYGVHVGRPTTAYRVHGSRLWRRSAERHDAIVAELRGRHPELFARRRQHRSASRSSLFAKVGLPIVEELPMPGRSRRALGNALSRPRSTLGLAVERRLNASVPRLRRPKAEEVVIVGAGPYGLSAAAHLRQADVPTKVFGDPMESWERHMPTGMLLRSRWAASQIADPERRLSLDRYHAEHDLEPTEPIPLDRFVDYGRWFQRRAVPDLDRRHVLGIARDDDGFRVELDDGERVNAARIVVATGIVPHASRPLPFESLPPSLVSHAADHADLGSFRNRRVVVVGGGQSALESAALLAEAGAETAVLVSKPAVEWLDELTTHGPLQRITHYAYRRIGVGGPRSSWIAATPPLFQLLPSHTRDGVTLRCIRPAGAGWLRPRLESVEIACGAKIAEAREHASGVTLELANGRRYSADHVLLATGYDIDVRRSSILDPDLASAIDVDRGYPRLGPGMESSVPGLHFLGAPAMRSFGPVMRFVCGTWYSSRSLTRKLSPDRTRRAVCSW
jgi:thioredoxin reductase